MWNIEDKTGTLYTQHETNLGHLNQHIKWLDNFDNRSNLPYPYSNICSVLETYMSQWREYYGIDVTCIVESNDDHYCSLMTSDKYESSDDLIWAWQCAFDLMLHDAAVTYVYKAAWTNPELKDGEKLLQAYAFISTQLWGLSRQLRVDMMREGMRK